MIKTFKRITFLFLLGLLVSNNALADNALTSNNSEKVKKIEDYLNSITFVKSEFVQESENNPGQVSEGMFYLSRPGKMRIEYKRPDRIAIVANDKKLVYKDFELDEDSKVATKKTPVYFLTKENISFDNDGLTVTNYEEDEYTKKISFVKTDKKEIGELTLFLEKNNLNLVAMEVKDEFGYKTKITLLKPSFKKFNENKLFDLKNVKTQL